MGVREVAVDAYREALPALGASAVGGLLAGVVLGGMRSELRAVEGLLVLVPALLAIRGNVYGALGARIATGLHQGVVEPAFDPDDERLRAAVAAAMANGLIASGFAAVLAYLALALVARTHADLWTLVAVSLVAAVLSGVVLTAAVVGLMLAGYRRGHNPDTLVGPIVTTTGDVTGLAFLLLAVRLVVGGVL